MTNDILYLDTLLSLTNELIKQGDKIQAMIDENLTIPNDDWYKMHTLNQHIALLINGNSPENN